MLQKSVVKKCSGEVQGKSVVKKWIRVVLWRSVVIQYWRSAMKDCCSQVLWKSVAVNVVEKCWEVVSWRSDVESCGEMLRGSVVEK